MKTTDTTVTITKEQLAPMPLVEYSSPITVIDTPQAEAEALTRIRRHPVVGFDTETRPSFRKGHPNKVALMQVSTDEESFVFRLNRLGFSQPMKEFVEDADTLKVGLSLKDDFHVMHRNSDFEPRGFIDLQKIVTQWRISDTSLQKIYGILFGRRISKGQRLSNWEASELTPAQQRYAAIDAWACLVIYRHLTQGLFDPEASPYRTEITPQQPSQTPQQ